MPVELQLKAVLESTGCLWEHQANTDSTKAWQKLASCTLKICSQMMHQTVDENVPLAVLRLTYTELTLCPHLCNQHALHLPHSGGLLKGDKSSMHRSQQNQLRSLRIRTKQGHSK